jgi:hypothetical protein
VSHFRKDSSGAYGYSTAVPFGLTAMSSPTPDPLLSIPLATTQVGRRCDQQPAVPRRLRPGLGHAHPCGAHQRDPGGHGRLHLVGRRPRLLHPGHQAAAQRG